jgi:hypothetical protein
VTAVAKGLAGALAAGTPEVALTGFDFNGKGTLLGNDWFWHGEFSLDHNNDYRRRERTAAPFKGERPTIIVLLIVEIRRKNGGDQPIVSVGYEGTVRLVTASQTLEVFY